MSYIVPTRDISVEDAKQYRLSTVEYIITRHMSLFGYQRNDLAIRDLLPNDLGLDNWDIKSYKWHSDKVNGIYTHDFNPTVHQVMNRLVNRKQDAVIGIYRILQLGKKPAATTIQFMNGTINLGKHALDVLYAGWPVIQNITKVNSETSLLATNAVIMEGYLTEPLIWSPGDNFRVEVEVRKESDDYLVLGGFVCEKIS